MISKEHYELLGLVWYMVGVVSAFWFMDKNPKLKDTPLKDFVSAIICITLFGALGLITTSLAHLLIYLKQKKKLKKLG